MPAASLSLQWVVRGFAGLFAGAVILYGGAWMYYAALSSGGAQLAVSYSYQLSFIVVGLAVLALRPVDPYAWLLAWLFANFISTAPFPRSIESLPDGLRQFVAAYRAACFSSTPASFYAFFAVFPIRSPLDRRLPWLKWLGVACATSLAMPGLSVGRPVVPAMFVRWFGEPIILGLTLAYPYPWLALGLVSLGWNAVSAPTPDTRRKARVLAWGTFIGITPSLARLVLEAFAGLQSPPWLVWTTVVLMGLFPLSFAYAVVKHRVLDIPVLVRRSARYVLVRRGFTVLIVLLAASVTALFTLSFSRWFDLDVDIAMAIGVAFGIVLSVGSAPLLRRTTSRIDFAFFRSAYDARAILQSLAEAIRTTTSREALAALLDRQVFEALHPATIAVYLESPDGMLRAQALRQTTDPGPLSPTLAWVQGMAQRRRPLEVQSSGEAVPLVLRQMRAECVVPMVGMNGRTVGLLILGPRLSEEPYSGEDHALLGAVANQAGIALENIHLAEGIAERLDTERAAARELEIARQVQRRLLPQKQPAMRTLDYAGACVQARQVGGDYYDFLDLGPGRLGFVLADLSGKGISGALLMANLQANLRSQYAIALDDLPRLLRSVNQLFCDSTDENRYATMFFGMYADATRQFRYANCGHHPPFVFHADGTVESLPATATVLGLFEDWDTAVCDITLRPGDTLVMYTDGIVEACNALDEPFESTRLIDTVRANLHLPAASLIHAIQAAVEDFSGGSPTDDLTVVAICVIDR
jgi:sigma-B regulation protein RsbU (phosphoserine phosphatase)